MLVSVSVVEIASFGYGSDTAAVLALGVVLAACVAWRRARPLVAVAAGMGAYALLAVVDMATNDLVSTTASLLVLVYSVAMWEHLRRSVVGLALAGAAVSAVIYGEGGKPLSDYAYAGALIVSAWGFGRAMRARIVQVSALAERAAHAEAEREHAAAIAVADERNRIARELHDIVSHGLSVMVVQAAAGEAAVDDSPAQAESAFRSIQEVGREAQAEMVRMLGVLRGQAGGGALSPTPGVDDIAALVERMRATGLPVTLSIEGDRRPLPAGVGLTAYRVVQEALTNVGRHAGTVATEVRITYAPAEVRVSVTNAPGMASSSPGAGTGLVGLRERVATCAGTLTAGPCAGGAFAVVAELPVPSP